MSSSSMDFCSYAATNVLEGLFPVPESSGRQRRIQELIAEIEEMEKTFSVLAFGTYFDKVVEMKDLLLEELVAAYTVLRKQDTEIERLNIVVQEKNKAIATLANENDSEKEGFNASQHELKALREKVSRLLQKERKYETMMLKLRKTDSARQEDCEDLMKDISREQ